MSQFSSGRHAKLTADPHRYVMTLRKRYEGRAVGSGDDFEHAAVVYAPRPEFDRPLTNPENPILLRMRMLRSDPDAIRAASSWILAIDRGHYDEYPKRMRDHARKVFARLEALS